MRGGARRARGDRAGGAGQDGGLATGQRASAGMPPPRQGPPKSILWKRNDTEVALMRQWLGASLAMGDYVSVDISPGGDRDNNEEFQVFQLLALTTKPILVETYPGEKSEAGLFEVSIQPLQIWSAKREEPWRRADRYVCWSLGMSGIVWPMFAHTSFWTDLRTYSFRLGSHKCGRIRKHSVE